MDSKRRRVNSNTHNNEKPCRSLPMQREEIPELPVDMMVDIFSRLPLKIITAYMSLSGDFKNLITTDHSLSHIYLTNKYNYFSSFYFNDSKPVYSLDLVELDKRDILEVKSNHEIEKVAIFNLDMLTGGGSCSECDYFTVSGYCNGLFCALKSQSGLYSLFVINPFLGEYIQLPKVLVYWCQSISFGYGIGYCQLTNRYKILIIITDYIGDGKYKNECGIFTIESDEIRKNVWRTVSDVNVPYNITPRQPQSPMVPFRSALHWFVEPLELSEMNLKPHWGGKQKYICAFDMTEEKVSALSLPLGVTADNISSLCVLSDKLCVWKITTWEDLDVQVWVMNEYGVGASWTMQFVLRRSLQFETEGPILELDRLHNIPRRPFTLILLAVSPGVIFASLYNKLVLYDTKKGEWGMVGGQSKHQRSYLSPFVPCFVSLRNLFHL